jgi:hypothetical protein
MKIWVKMYSDCGYVGADRHEEMELEVEDDLSEADLNDLIEEETRDWFFNYNSYWFDIVKKDS